MLKRTFLMAVVFATIAAAPLSAMAADDTIVDGRLEGYGKSVILDGGGTALSWLLTVGLGVLALGVLFKSANRTHLD